MKGYLIFLIICLFQHSIFSQGQIINVPGDQPTIQAAIDAAVNGDTVLVAEGTYFENISYKSKAITVASHFLIDQDETHIDNTIIDGSQPNQVNVGAVVRMESGEDSLSVLYGFTITGGTGYLSPDGRDKAGGGIFIDHSGGKIQYNKIVHNTVVGNHPFAAGIFVHYPNSPVVISNNMISHNIVTSTLYSNVGGGVFIRYDNGQFVNFYENLVSFNSVTGNGKGAGGGGIAIWNSNSIVRNNIIKNNKAQRGGGIDIVDNENLEFAHPTIINNVIINNTAADFGGGIMAQYDAYPEIPITNCIIYGNASTDDPQVSMGQAYDVIGTYEVPVEYSDVEGGFIGNGNINLDPQFADTTNYYLSQSSPCIDTGNPKIIFNDIEDPSNPGFALFPGMGGFRNDMGAYGGNPNMILTPQRIFENIDLTSRYFIPGDDTLTVTSKIFSPKNQAVEVKAIIENEDESIKDTLVMTDDNFLGDDIYVATWPVPGTEDFFDVHIQAYLTEYDHTVTFENAQHFTTVGPINIDSLTLTQTSFNKQVYMLALWGQNHGLEKSVDNCTVNIASSEDIVTKLNPYDLSFTNLMPGKKVSGNSFSYVTLDTSFTGGFIPFKFSLSKDGITYWEDNDSIYVAVTSIDDNVPSRPTQFSLHQNYPNPFNPTTTIKYSIPLLGVDARGGFVTIKVFDILGREVATLVNEPKSPGNYHVEFDASNLSSGIYFYRLTGGGFDETKKMILLR